MNIKPTPPIKAKPDPRNNPPKGHQYLCIVTPYKDLWYDGCGFVMDVGRGKLVMREIGDGTAYFFSRVGVNPSLTPTKKGKMNRTEIFTVMRWIGNQAPGFVNFTAGLHICDSVGRGVASASWFLGVVVAPGFIDKKCAVAARESLKPGRVTLEEITPYVLPENLLAYHSPKTSEQS